MSTRVRDLSDANVLPLDSTKNKYVLKYNATTDKFEVVSVDDVLIKSTETPIPEDFIDQVEQELGDLQAFDYDFDGGGF